MSKHSIGRVKDDLRKLHEKAVLTRKKTRSSEDRDFVMLITNVVMSLWGESPRRGGEKDGNTTKDIT